MRNDALTNGGLIGLGLGFVLASLALYRVISIVIPAYAGMWVIRGIIIFGAVALVVGIGVEVYQRKKAKKEQSEP